MNIVINFLYMVTLAAIKVFRMFTYVPLYIGFKPVKAYAIKKLNAAGIGVDGTEPHDLLVHNDWFFHRLAHEGTIGIGEAYIDGWWDCRKIDECFAKALRFGFYKEFMFPWEKLIYHLQYRVFNLQTSARSWEIAEKHYNLGK